MPSPQLIDERDDADPVIPEGHTLANLDEEQTSTEPTAEQQQLAEDVDSTIPEKYQGKTPAELAEMLVEAERFQGRQSQEVGQLRKDLDAVIQAQLATAQAPATATPEVEEDPVDFFTDPEAAMDQRINKHPAVKAAREEAANLQKQTAQARLKEAHPDMDAIVQDAKFASWVGESPVRTELLQKAHFQFDFNAANELFSTWKERQALSASAATAAKTTADKNLQAAKTGAQAPASAGTPKKVYRRADIVRLMRDDPDRYLALAPEIERAYAEHRVV